MPQWRARSVPTVLPSDPPVTGPTGVALTRTMTLPVARPSPARLASGINHVALKSPAQHGTPRLTSSVATLTQFR
jgi:hypothetical protein